MEGNIFRSERSNIIRNQPYLYYDKHKSSEEQFLGVKRYSYINKFCPQEDDYNIHVYRCYLCVFGYGLMETNIKIPFNFVNKYYFYIDYLYYRRVINELSFIILINRRHLIEVFYLDIRNFKIISSINEDDDKYKKDNYKTIRVESNLVHDYNK